MFKRFKSNRSSPLVNWSACFLACGIAVLSPAQVTGFQTLSPSTTQLQGDPVADELNNLNAEPLDRTAALLNSMNNLIPGQISELGIEDDLKNVASLFLDGKVPETVEAIKAVRTANPVLPPATLLVAGMLFTAGNSQQGSKWLEQAAVDEPDYPLVYTSFSRIAISQNRVTDAEALLEKASRLIDEGSWDEKVKAHFQSEYLDGITDVRIRRGNIEQAKEHLIELESILPNEFKVQLRLAQVEFDLDQIDASLKYLEKSKSLQENLRAPEVIIADWLYQKRKLDESEAWIKKAAEKYPNDGNVQLDYGKWLLKTEQLREAMTVADKAEKLGANSYIVSYLKGQAAFARRSYDVAEMHFEELNRLRPGDANATNMLALSLIESDDRAKKSKAFDLALMNQRLYPNSAATLATLGWIQFRLGSAAEAEKAFQQLTSTQNLEPASAYFVAVFLDNAGDFENAAGLLNASLEQESFFLYRSVAKDLLVDVQKKLDAQKNAPKDDESGDKSDDQSP